MSESADLLSNALESLRVESSAIGVFEFTDPWGFSVDFHQPFSWTVVDGAFWLVAPQQPPLRLGPGDSIVLPRGTHSGTYLFLSAPESHAYPGEELWRQAEAQAFRPGRRLQGPQFIRWGGGGPRVTRIVSMAFSFVDRDGGPSVNSLPERIVVRADEVAADFMEVLLRFPFGGGDREPGFSAIATQTAQLLLMYLVRTHALRDTQHGPGWVGALSDPRIAKAVAAMHGQPQREWTVASLAAAAGMSRSTFALEFAACLGQTPARYLRDWRMHLARELLASGRPVTQLASDLGYRSEAAFRAAFRRSAGAPPRSFRHKAVP